MAPSLSGCTSPVTLLPGLSAPKKLQQTGKLLRRPLAPRILPTLTNKEDQDVSSKEYSRTDSLMKMFQSTFNLDALKDADADTDITTEGESPDPILACPPPTSGSESRHYHTQIKEGQKSFPDNVFYKYPTDGSGDLFISCGDRKYILDPAYKGRTSVDTHITGKSLVRHHKPRGPDPLPVRTRKKNPKNFIWYDTDDVRYYQPPAFMLEHFVCKLAESSHYSVPQVKTAVYSKHCVKKLTDLLSQELNRGGQESLHTQNLDPSSIPLKENRIPQRQLLYEMVALLKSHVQEETGREVRSGLRLSAKYSPEYSIGTRPVTAIVLYEDDSTERASAESRRKRETEMPGADAIVRAACSRFFQGLQRSKSPLCVAEDETISPSEMAVLDSLITGGTALSFSQQRHHCLLWLLVALLSELFHKDFKTLKNRPLSAHFIDALPDISTLQSTLTYLNLCFNNFKNFPTEILDLSNLEVLKMRNNPLVEISSDINKLQKLRVFHAPFCLITALPKLLFDLPCLDDLSVAYNRLTFIPSDICRLKSLQILDIEGNQIPALPATCVTMETLTQLNVRNTFMHPLFWHESTRNKAQSLCDLASVRVCRTRLPSDLQNLPSEVMKILARQEVCDICKGPLFGPGLRAIRPMSRLFSVKNVPILFRACTPGCLDYFQTMSIETLRMLLYGE